MDELLALVRSRYCYPLTHHSQTPPEKPYEFQWLQKDIGWKALHPPSAPPKGF